MSLTDTLSADIARAMKAMDPATVLRASLIGPPPLRAAVRFRSSA